MTVWAIVFDLPQPYGEMARLQERLVAARIAEEIPDLVLFLEHQPVVTLGRRGRENFLRLSREQLAARGIELVHSTRGGDVTYHGPGQIVIYPILKLGTHEADVHGHLWNLEEIAIRTAADSGVEAFRREGMTGAWTREGKIAAVGVRLKRWVTSHGMSFNVDLDLTGFETIVPCGLAGERVASMKAILGARCPALGAARESMLGHVEAVFGRSLERLSSRQGLPAVLEHLLRAPG
ncbi:MAG: lipoyl(octanoyl) transferase LipB [Kiritimatiellae bacterium]|nr:lipoyl(octanoyl) transferase LipB [Kiritimatiellia bacterium]